MDILIKIIQFVVSLSLLVIIHELGHFLFARLFKTRVEKFYLFFNPWFSLFKFKRGDTEYGVGWVPLGGYVKISGMIDESMDTEQMKQPAQPYEFRSKPAWQRLLIMTGGVLMNVLLAICIYIGLSYAYGDNYIAAKDAKYGYVFSDLAQEIGFKNGDKILTIAGEPVEDYIHIQKNIVFNAAEYVEVDRDGKKEVIYIKGEDLAQLINDKGFLDLRLPFIVGDLPADSDAAKAGFMAGDQVVAVDSMPMTYVDQIKAVFSQNVNKDLPVTVKRDSAGFEKLVALNVHVNGEGVIGVYLLGAPNILTVSRHEYSLIQAIPAGFTKAGQQINEYVKQLKLMFNPDVEAYKSLGGFISIGKIFPSEWNWYSFWQITAFLSIILAVMNILPIPALDGGHVLFLLYEVVTRRKPSEKFMERAQMVGLVILLGLVVFANANDIYKLFL